MITKECQCSGWDDERGPAFHILRPGYDDCIDKVKLAQASPAVLDQVRSIMRTLGPKNGKLFALVSALGASEYYGPNCLPKGTPIAMASGGWMPVELVAEGDEVVTHTGQVRSVTKTYQHWAEGLIEVRPQGQCAGLFTTAGHPYYVVRKEQAQRLLRKHVYKRSSGISLREARTTFVRSLKPEWVEAQYLREGDFVFVSFPTEVQEHPNLVGDDMAFLLGVYAADGCTMRRRRTNRGKIVWREKGIVLTINGDAVQVRDRIVRVLETRGLSPRVTDQYQGSNVCRIEAYSAKLTRLCLEHIGKGSSTKEFSPELLRMPHGWQRTFLDAYLARDGYSPKEGTKEYGAVRLSTTSPALAQGVRLLAARLGTVSTVCTGKQHHTSLGAGNTIYEVRIPKSQLKGGRIGVESYLDMRGFIVCPIKEINYLDDWEGPVYNFEVEENNSYVASGVVVHNSNGDDFPESALLHTPEGWSTMSHRMQRMAGKGWEWGYPTFYNANFFQHHKNGDPNKAFGSVEYVVWDPEMKRVLLIVALDRSRAETEGAVSVIDRIEHGEYPSVSMGAKVPYDLCAVCCDWSRITGNPKRDLAEHKRRPIQGLSVTTRDYCSHIRFECGKVYPSGLQVKMVNLHPRFFDISAVFIGADKTSYVLAKLAGYCPIKPGARVCPKGCRDCSLPSSAVREVAALEKVAAANFAKHSPKGKVIPFSKGKMTKRSQFDDYIDPQTEESVASYFQRKVQRGF